MLAVKTVDLRKYYTIQKSFLDRIRGKPIKLEALKGINLEIKKSEIFGLLGPNGAGKTTLMNIISTILLPDSGKAEVFGFDVVEQAEEVRKIISLSSAFSGFYYNLTVKENLKFFGMIYDTETDVRELISLVDLEKYENTFYEDLSSGNKQKMIIAKSLLGNPKLLLMDELTVALDPKIALNIRNLVKIWRKKEKTTVLLATHNMLEADELCDRIAIIHAGEIVACDISKKLKKLIREEDVIEIEVSESRNPSFLLKMEGIKRMSFKNYRIAVHVDDAERRLERIIKKLHSRNYHIKSVKVEEPTLEDAFLKLTGVELG